MPVGQPGTKVDRFHLVKFLGRGAFGEVWEVREDGTMEHKALKLIRCGLRQEEDEIAREASALRACQGPNIVRFFELVRNLHVQGSAMMGILMELCPGGTATRLLHQGALEETTIVEFMLQLLRGLNRIHTIGNTLHRDLKLANILLRADGSPVICTSASYCLYLRTQRTSVFRKPYSSIKL